MAGQTKKRLLAVTVSALFFISMASASSNWNLNTFGEPYNLLDVSNDSKTVKPVNLTDNDGNYVDESTLENDDAGLFYNYNASREKEVEMQHLAKGFYYAEFRPNHTEGEFIEYELEDDSSGGFETNQTEQMNIGNITVEIETDFSGQVDPDRNFDLKVNTTDEANDTFEDNADTDLYITNITWTSNIVDLANEEQDTYWKNFGNSFDLAHDSSYIVTANASYSSASYINPDGSNSMVFQTSPALEGEIEYLNASSGGCNNNSFFDECERGAEIDTGFNVTGSSASQVNLSLMAEDDSGNWHVLEFQELTEEEGIYNGTVTFPDVNTSKYSDTVRFEYNATGSEGQEFIEARNVTSKSFKVQDRSSTQVDQGETHDVELLLANYFSLDSLDMSRFDNGSITLEEPDGETFEEFNLSDMTYSSESGLFEYPVSIPGDAETGSYDLHAEIYNIYGEKKALDSAFNVKDVDATFNVTDNFERDVNKTGTHEYNVTVNSESSSSIELMAEIDGEIENMTQVNDGENITLPASGKEVELQFNVSSVDDYEGEITLVDTSSNYNQTIDVELEAPECDLRDGSLCIRDTDDGWENVTATETGDVERAVEVMYLGEKNSSIDVDAVTTGEISSYLSVNPVVFSLNQTHDTRQIDLTFSPGARGNFSGEVVFSNGDEVSLKTWLEANIDSQDQSISVTTSLDLGYLESGGSVTETVEIENTGSSEVESLSVSSIDYDATVESISIPAGESRSVDLTLSNIEAESGSVTLTAETSAGSIERTISITANPVPDYSERVSELEDRIANLESRAESEETVSRLEELSLQLSDIESAYNSGDYQAAEQNFNQVQSQLDSIESEIGSSSTGPQTGNTGGSGGGAPVIPIAVGLFVLLLIGFVAYTSVELEEGDPLYGLLGE